MSPRTMLMALAVVEAAGVSRVSAATLTVCGSGCAYNDFQRALDGAQPGDTLLLRAGETFVGNFTLPVKSNASGAYILIRSDASDAAFPASDARLIPSGYPGGNTDRAALARLVGKGGQWKTTPVVQTAPGAHHYRLQFLDIDGVAQEGWETLVEFGNNDWEQSTLDAVPFEIVMDRVFIHGHSIKGQKRCLSLNGRNLDVRNSYIAGCSNFAFDAQAIAGFNGPGPFKIVNNYLEASGENVMFGGADPKIYGLVPSDIEIRSNYLTKPLAWRDPILSPPSGAPRATVYAGVGALASGVHYFRVVAVLEVESDIALSTASAEQAVRVDDDGAAIGLTWDEVAGADRYRVYVGSSPGAQNRYIETRGPDTSFTYTGSDEIWESPPVDGTRWSVKNLLELKNAERATIDGNVFEHLWPASQKGYAILLTPRNQDGAAPWSVVRDVTFTNNIIRHLAGGFAILGEDDEADSLRTERITIRNNLVYDMSAVWGGASHFLVMTRSPSDVKIDHNSIFHEGMVVLVDDGQVSGFEFTNNVTPHNAYGIFGSGAGSGNGAIAAYFPGAVVRRNAFGGGPASSYPADNFFPDIATFWAQFVDPDGADFRLVASSSFHGIATDGRDLGVDFAALSVALRGVAAIDSSRGLGGGSGASGAGSGVSDVGAGPRAPFRGAPVTLPGIIQAENFDDGGSGVAYSDKTSGNSGGEYRSGDVDIEATSDEDGGYDVGWIDPGEWLTYSVSVTAARSYTLEIRVASAASGGTFHIETNGVDVTGPLTIPNTGGWQAWTTVSVSGVNLSAGPQLWKIVFDGLGHDGVVGNINYIRVTPSSGTDGVSLPFGGTPALLPGMLQAEDFDVGGEGIAYHDASAGNEGGEYRSTDVDIEQVQDGEGEYSIGWISEREWLRYTVEVRPSGTYDIEFRVACNGPGGTFHVEMNGVNRTGAIVIPDTGGWQNWTTVVRSRIELDAGQQVWRVVMDTAGPNEGVGNLNYIRVVPSGN